MEEQTLKIFTIEEANKLLPVIDQRMRGIMELNLRAKALATDIQDLFSIWGKEVTDITNVDNAYYIEKTSAREAVIKEITEKVRDINSLGVIVKDHEAGLVDFHSEHRGSDIFLCWKYGEDRISHWHAGSDERRDLRELR